MELFFIFLIDLSRLDLESMTKKRTDCDCVSKKIYLDLDRSIVRYDIWYDKVGPKYELMNHNMIMSKIWSKIWTYES